MRLLPLLFVMSMPAFAQNPVDTIRPDAPALATPGPHAIGVQTLRVTDQARPDVIASLDRDRVQRSDRMLTVEIWYPAAPGTEPGGTYQTVLRDGDTPVTLSGQAQRDAAPDAGAYPLVLLSHGYPGNRFLMAHLGENLASKGYVVAAADHPDSTYSDQGAFVSTLVNRPLDQAFLVDALAALDGPFGALIDAENVAVVGYSMGGYGALIFGGGGLSQTAITRQTPDAFVPPHNLLAQHAAGGDDLAALVDPRVKALVAIGPWGRNHTFWDADSLAPLSKPLLLVAGSEDDVSDYPAMRRIWQEASGAPRHLLTFDGANHNAAAPIPAPQESYAISAKLGWAPFEHYADAVWDTARMNNILQHFVTAHLDVHLKGQADKAAYLDVVPNAADGVWSMDDAGTAQADHSYWPGFANRTAKGLRLEYLPPE
ncbi:MAG: alpha/beta fold hydrolase [Pseudomonadota bacterium]